jgi:glutamyl-tRNA synthetase
MARNTRVRFAPSPTGPLHIGGARTALFNYLFAKKNNGSFVLRIEDTDRSRYVQGAEDYIVDSLNWLGITFDEGPGKDGGFGPYRQSERKDLYKKYVDMLVESGNAYFAFDTFQELEHLRKQYESKGNTFIYNWHNRERFKNSFSLSSEEVKSRIERGDHFVVRFKSPHSKSIALEDIIRGRIEVDTKLLDDKVLFKSDGMPTYHLANVVDDHLMEISHVIRGEEWLPSLALHILLYRAFKWEPPKFAHLPLIMKPEGKGKLSKRDGDKMGFPVFPLEWKNKAGEVSLGYRENGYLPEAVVNMLALLGWNPGTEQELFTLSELADQFELKRVHKSGARFDPEKTKWFQHHYLQQVDDNKLAEQFALIVSKRVQEHTEGGDFEINEKKIIKIVSLLKERVTFVEDLWDQGNFFFIAPNNYDEKAAKKAFKDNADGILSQVMDMIASIELFTSEIISKKVKDWILLNDLGFGKVMMPLRLALVGEMKGPDVFVIISLLGKEEAISRIQCAINYIDQK